MGFLREEKVIKLLFKFFNGTMAETGQTLCHGQNQWRAHTVGVTQPVGGVILWRLCTAHTVRGGLEPQLLTSASSFDLDGELAALTLQVSPVLLITASSLFSTYQPTLYRESLTLS